MLHMNPGFHHWHKKNRRISKSGNNTGKLAKLVDKSIYFLAVIGALSIVPQLIKVWTDNSISGVSLLTWVGFMVGSVFWVIYGMVHKERPILFTNSLILVIQFFIVAGLIIRK